MMARSVVMDRPGSVDESDAEGKTEDCIGLPVGSPYVLTRYCSLDDFSSMLSWQLLLLFSQIQLAGKHFSPSKPRGIAK